MKKKIVKFNNYPSFSELKDIILYSLSGKQWKIIGEKPLGSGMEAIVCLGELMESKIKKYYVAIKIAYDNTSLFYEKNILKSLKDIKEGFPKLIDEGFDKEKKIIFFMEELLGDTIEDIFKKNKGFSNSTLANIAIQLINSLEKIHEKGYVIRDISSKNILNGRDDNSNKLYFIDLGIAQSINKTGEKKHIDIYKKQQLFEGTPIFGSINGLIGKGQTRRDDLESLAYLLIYLNKGNLPWEKKAKKIKKWTMKNYQNLSIEIKNFPIDELCLGLPNNFKKYLNIVRKLNFSEQPNYELLKNLFEKESKKKNSDFSINKIESKKKNSDLLINKIVSKTKKRKIVSKSQLKTSSKKKKIN